MKSVFHTKGRNVVVFLFFVVVFLAPQSAFAAPYDITQIDSVEHDTLNGISNSLVQIDSTHFMLAYAGSGSDGFIKTFSIDGSYNITEIDSLEHDTLNGTYNSLIQIDSTHFMLAYAGSGVDGFIKTFSIDGSYNITQIDSLEHDTVNGDYNSLVKIDDTHFMLAYDGTATDGGQVKTFSIDGSYNITQIDSLEHDAITGFDNSLVKIDDTHFMLAYAGSGNDGFIKTFSIDGSYNITQIDSLEHDTVNGNYNSLVKIDDTHFILAYSGDSSDGFIKTFSIEPPPPTVTTNAVTSVTGTTATINGEITAVDLVNANERGFAWGTETNLSGGDTATTSSFGDFGTGAFSQGLSSLDESTTYYFRAFAANSVGTSTGTILNFTTDSAPSVTTNAASSITNTSAALNASITDTGGENANERGFAWGTEVNLSGGDTATTSSFGDFGTGAFSSALSELTKNTTYYFRGYAANSVGTSTGSILSFVAHTPSRKIRLFEGTRLKIQSGKVKIQ